MKFGVHISVAGGLVNAPENAKVLDCETFQFFSRSPRGGSPSAITKKIADEFMARCRNYNLSTYYIHTPYYINFASSNSRIRRGSIEVVRQELERGNKLGVRATMTHLGSAKDIASKEIVAKVSAALIEMLGGYKGENQFLIEIAAGSGQIIGSRFEEVAKIIKSVEKKIKTHKIGVCFDTAHAFASGYDLRDQKSVNNTLGEFDSIIGLERLIVIHANDSLVPLASRKDRHANIGKGKIGRKGFAAILRYPKLKKKDFILETPWNDEKEVKKDLKILKGLRAKR